MQAKRKRANDVGTNDAGAKKADHVVPKASPVSISACYNKNGVQEVFVLYSDGSIKVKRESNEWEQISLS